jgi:hypothetical protein
MTDKFALSSRNKKYNEYFTGLTVNDKLIWLQTLARARQ